MDVTLGTVETPPPAAPSFTVHRVSVGTGNCDYANRKAFAQAQVELGPFRFFASVDECGAVMLPSILIDGATTLAIAEAVWDAVLDEVRSRWEITARHDRERYSKRVPLSCPASPKGDSR